MSSSIDKLRELCLQLPEAHEVEAWGEPTFRVKNKIFAMYASSNTHHGAGRPAVWVKAGPGEQDLLIRAAPERFFVPPYVGKGGWVGVWLDKRPKWKEIELILRDAYRLTAPKKLLPLLEDNS